MEKKKKAGLDFENSEYSLWTEKIKKAFNIDSEKDFANLLGIQPSGYSHFKRSNKFPFDKIVELYIEKGLSLDNLFGIKSTTTISRKEQDREKNKYDIPFLLNKDKVLSIPMLLSQNENNSLYVFSQDNILYIVNTSIKKYTKKANYLIEKNDVYYIRNIDMSLDGSYELYEINTQNISKNTFTVEEFEKFNIVGMIEYFLKAELQRV